MRRVLAAAAAVTRTATALSRLPGSRAAPSRPRWLPTRRRSCRTPWRARRAATLQARWSLTSGFSRNRPTTSTRCTCLASCTTSATHSIVPRRSCARRSRAIRGSRRHARTWRWCSRRAGSRMRRTRCAARCSRALRRCARRRWRSRRSSRLSVPSICSTAPLSTARATRCSNACGKARWGRPVCTSPLRSPSMTGPSRSPPERSTRP